MSISVDIADRLYDYTDEEKAADAISLFQASAGLDDMGLIALWNDFSDPRRSELERAIIEAVDANGTAKRARDSVPGEINLIIVP